MRDLAYAFSDEKFFEAPPMRHVEVSAEFAKKLQEVTVRSRKSAKTFNQFLGSKHGRAFAGLTVQQKKKKNDLESAELKVRAELEVGQKRLYR